MGCFASSEVHVVQSVSHGPTKTRKRRQKKHKVKKRKTPYVQRKMAKIKKAKYFRCSNFPYHHWNENENGEMWITEEEGTKFKVHSPGLTGKKGTVSF